eukprot:TCONS_00068783-protein
MTEIKNKIFTGQATNGVKDYSELSKIVQETFFDYLVKDVKIENGWKVLDIGCGTGNNSFKLSQMVGEQGKIVAIDPIKDRITEANSSYSSPNLHFYEGSAKDVTKFGSDFDLVVAATVIHWIPPQERQEVFQGIMQTMKEGAQFIFNMTKKDTFNMIPILAKIKTNPYKGGNYWPVPEIKDIEQLASNSGYRDVQVKEQEMVQRLPSLDQYLRWAASSFHTRDYDQTLKELRDVCQNEDVSCLYDKDGHLVYKQKYFFAYCRK